MYRVKNGIVYVPHIFEDGTYGAADPDLGRQRHLIRNRALASSIEELRMLHERGFPIWMAEAGTRNRTLISKGIIMEEPPFHEVPPRDDQVVYDRPRQVAHMAEAANVESYPTGSKGEFIFPDSAEMVDLVARMPSNEFQQELRHPDKLSLGDCKVGGRHLHMAWAPFDYINAEAKIVIVGITPGAQQMKEALSTLRETLHVGASIEGAVKRAKLEGSFAGAMRGNIAKMLDALGVNRLLGIQNAISLFDVDGDLAHFTSVLRYPTFVDGQNYSRVPDLIETDVLLDYAQKVLGPELEMFPDALFVPMGDMVANALCIIGKRHGIAEQRILKGFPHAAQTNASRIKDFLSGDDTRGYGARFAPLVRQVEELIASQPDAGQTLRGR